MRGSLRIGATPKLRIFYALTKYEDAALTQCTMDLKDGFPHGIINSYIFDVFVAITPADVENDSVVEVLRLSFEQSSHHARWSTEKL